MPSSYHWIERFIRRWEFLLDDEAFEGAEAMADLVDEATGGDWSRMTPSQQEALEEQLVRLKNDLPWSDTEGNLTATLERWRARLAGARTPSPEDPLPEHWVARLVDREATLRIGSPHSSAAHAGIGSMLERLDAADWADSGLALNAILADGGTLYHRAASEWPDALAAMMDAEPPQPVPDASGLLAYEVLARDWDGEHFRPVIEAMRAHTTAQTLQDGLPETLTRPRAARL